MSLSELIDELEDILYSQENDDPDILIKVGEMIVNLESVKYFPEDDFYEERIMLS